ncbi:hypothetical protein YC2023_032630 [Brassica napus]
MESKAHKEFETGDVISTPSSNSKEGRRGGRTQQLNHGLAGSFLCKFLGKYICF